MAGLISVIKRLPLDAETFKLGSFIFGFISILIIILLIIMHFSFMHKVGLILLFLVTLVITIGSFKGYRMNSV